MKKKDQDKVEQLLSTKFYIPTTRKDIVSRQRLIRPMNDGLRRKLTLISAPAGFGKTTLVCEWIEDFRSNSSDGDQENNIIAWLSLDEKDDDPVSFMTYFIGAIKQANRTGADFGGGALGMLQSPQPPVIEEILVSLINEIASFPARIILILDDYHLTGSAEIADGLSFLIEHQPPNFHLIIATREDPQLPLSRLRAGGQLNELRATELRFTPPEAAEFLNKVMKLNISEKDVAALENRTEGWIAGLQLAAISIHGREDASGLIQAFTGSHRLVLDYLIEEVLKQQSENMQNFLLRTAVLDRMTGALCNTLTGREDGEAILEELEHSNLFIVPLDVERRWYRYHHLFSELLRSRLHKTQLEQVTTLHQKASIWFEKNKFFDEAIEHAYHAKDHEKVVDLIDKNSEAIWREGEHIKLRRWLAKIPKKLITSKPNLCILNAWDQFSSGQLQAAEQTLDNINIGDIESSPKKDAQSSNSKEMMIQGRAAAIRAFLASHRGDIKNIIRYSNQALEYLPEKDLSWRSAAAIALGDGYSFNREVEKAYQIRIEAYELSKAAGNIYLNLIASMKLAVTMRNLGRLRQIIELCEKQMQLVNDHGMAQMAGTGWLLAVWGEVLAETNDLDGAIDQVRKGVELTELGTDIAMRGWAYLCMLRVLYSRREMDDIDSLLDKMENFTRDFHAPPWVTTLMEAWKARIWLAQDNLVNASKWVEERKLDYEHTPLPIEEHEYLAFTRILVAQGRVDESIRLLDRMLKAAEDNAYISRVIEILILKALAFQSDGDLTNAMTNLNQALNLAEPGGFIRIFLDEGAPFAQLLNKAIYRGIASDYAGRLLPYFQDFESEKAAPEKMLIYKDEYIEPLSEREIDVLKLIAEGLTNQEIAGRLYLSLNTIKVHNRHIFAKLNANSRLQAVSKARDMGILEHSDHY